MRRAPADIKYPTDLGLLNHAREILEGIIDTLHQPHIGRMEKPRTYRDQARKSFLNVSKQRKPKGNTMRKAIKKQLAFVGWDLRIIEVLRKHTPLTELNNTQYRRLLVIGELYRQQDDMMKKGTHSVPDRIVSIEQPHVRPIVRGKAGASVEFGEGKRRFGLGLIRARRSHTSETVIALQFLVMNLERRLRVFFLLLFRLFFFQRIRQA